MSPFSRHPDRRIVPSEQISEATDRDLEAWGIMPLLDYWNALRGEAFAPRWRDFNIVELPPQVRGGLVVLDYDPAKNDFRVRFWGVDLWDIFGIDITGAWLSDVEHSGVMTQFLKFGADIINTKAPQKIINRAKNATGETVLYPVLRLPLSDDGVRVDKVVTVRNAKKLGRRHKDSAGDTVARTDPA